MKSLFNVLASVRLDRRGVTALEYGLIAAAVVAVGLAGFSALEGSLSAEFNTVAASMPPTE